MGIRKCSPSVGSSWLCARPGSVSSRGPLTLGPTIALAARAWWRMGLPSYMFVFVCGVFTSTVCFCLCVF